MNIYNKGKIFVESQLGLRGTINFQCPRCDGFGFLIPSELSELKQQMVPYFVKRGSPNTRIDQAFATPETSFKRTIFLLEHDYLEGRQVIFIGGKIESCL